MLYNIHKVITIYDYGNKGQSIVEIDKAKPESIEINIGDYNELLGDVSNSKVDYSEEPINLIDRNGHLRFSRAVDKATAIFLYVEPGYILNHISVNPVRIDTDIFLKEYDFDTQIIYAFFCSTNGQITIKAQKIPDDTIKSKILQSPQDLVVRRILLERCSLDYTKELSDEKDVLRVEEVATLLGVTKGTIQNKVSNGKFLRPHNVGGTKVWNKKELLQWIKRQ